MSTSDTVEEFGTSGSPTLATSSSPREGAKASPLGRMPTESLAICCSPPAAKMPIVFSPRFAVKRRSRSSEKHARDALQSVQGVTETVGGGVHDVDIIVRRMGDVEPRRSMMNRSVIETALLCMRGKIDGAQQPEAHQVACSNLAFPSTLSLQ